MSESLSNSVRLMVVSREPTLLRPLWSIGESNAWHVETAGSGWEAMERVEAGATPDVLLLDLPRGDGDSLHVVRWLRRLRPDMPIILLAHTDDAMREKEASRLGAQDFLVRPFDERRLELAIRKQVAPSDEDNRESLTSDNVEHLGGDMFFVGLSPAMQKLRAQAELLAQASVPVLIIGEAGSGKDTIAQLIHRLSVRSEFKFLKVNCAALSDELLGLELFGHTGKPFDQDDRSRPGKIELCDNGTIFLDEIVKLPLRMQEELLHVMQTKQFSKPGSRKSFDVDVRVLAATEESLDKALSERVLGEGLYYRLSAYTIHVPPLRHRKDEIPILLHHFMHKLAKRYGLPARELSPAVLEAGQRYSWPGNLRELENFVKRYLLLGDVTMGWSEAQTFDIAKRSKDASLKGETLEPAAPPRSLKSLITDVKCEAERNAIGAALEKTGWNRKAAARLLKISYRTMLYKIERYEMHSPDTYSSPFASHGSGNGFKGNGKRV